MQSELPNCYLASAADAVAYTRPEALVRSIVRMRRGHYRVRFQAIDRTGRAMARDVEVSSALYVRPSGELLYGSCAETTPALWWPLLEKAFARLKGSYRKIGKGGCSDLILQALLGRRARRFFVESRRAGEAERVWGEMKRALDARLPVVAGTAPPFATQIYRNTGVVPDHAYAVHWCREEKGVRSVGCATVGRARKKAVPRAKQRDARAPDRRVRAPFLRSVHGALNGATPSHPRTARARYLVLHHASLHRTSGEAEVLRGEGLVAVARFERVNQLGALNVFAAAQPECAAGLVVVVDTVYVEGHLYVLAKDESAFRE